MTDVDLEFRVGQLEAELEEVKDILDNLVQSVMGHNSILEMFMATGLLKDLTREDLNAFRAESEAKYIELDEIVRKIIDADREVT